MSISEGPNTANTTDQNGVVRRYPVEYLLRFRNLPSAQERPPGIPDIITDVPKENIPPIRKNR